MFTSGAKNYVCTQTVGPVLVPVFAQAFVSDCRYAESSFLVFEIPGSTGVIHMLRGWG